MNAERHTEAGRESTDEHRVHLVDVSGLRCFVEADTVVEELSHHKEVTREGKGRGARTLQRGFGGEDTVALQQLAEQRPKPVAGRNAVDIGVVGDKGVMVDPGDGDCGFSRLPSPHGYQRVLESAGFFRRKLVGDTR